jgi:hypothetical protein
MSKLAYNFDIFQKRVDAVDRSNGKRSGLRHSADGHERLPGILIQGRKTPANLKLKVPHFNRCARTEVLLFGFAINCSRGIDPALHDGLPGATGTSNHAQQSGDGGYFAHAPKGYLPPREQGRSKLLR